MGRNWYMVYNIQEEVALEPLLQASLPVKDKYQVTENNFSQVQTSFIT